MTTCSRRLWRSLAADRQVESGSNTIHAMSEAYQGASYGVLVEQWQSRSNTHMTELMDVCRVISDALHAFADYILMQKGVAIGELLALAASFLAAQAAAPFTFGLSEVADLGLDELAEQAINLLKQLVVQYIEGQVIQAAFARLAPVVEKAVEGWVFNLVDGGVPTGGGGQVGKLMMVDGGPLRAHAATMRAHGQSVFDHAQNLTERLSGVDYT